MTGVSWRLQVHETLASTSDFCIERALAGEPAGLAVLAQTQTRGRGTRGRSWMSAEGALAFSVLLRPGAGEGGLASVWPFVAAVALHDAFALTPQHGRSLRLKWPNDIMLEERKLAGILIERAPPAQGDAGWLVLGFGANLGRAPAVADRPTACLAELGAVPDASAIADRLLAALTVRLGDLETTGFEAVRQAWLARAHPAGTPLSVQTPAGETVGCFSSIAEDGTLLLRVGGSITRVSGGAVVLARR